MTHSTVHDEWGKISTELFKKWYFQNAVLNIFDGTKHVIKIFKKDFNSVLQGGAKETISWQ